MTQVDTPDYQRGVISAQKLLGTIAAGDTSVTVGVPPNAETIVCMVKDQASDEGAYCVGASTGLVYPSGAIVLSVGATNTVTVWFDVSGAVDDQVIVNLFSAATDTTYIYSDSAVHTTNDPVTVDVLHAAMDDGNNAMYTIPRPPGIGAGDHPAVELKSRSAYNFAPGADIVNAPGAGMRLRIFALQVVAASSGSLAWAADSGTNFVLCFGGVTPGFMQFEPSGFAMSTDAALIADSTAGNIFAVVVYTTESV